MPKLEMKIRIPRWMPKPKVSMRLTVRAGLAHEHIGQPVEVPDFGAVMLGRCQDSLYLKIGRFTLSAAKLNRLPKELRDPATLAEELSKRIGDQMSQEIHEASSGLGWPFNPYDQ